MDNPFTYPDPDLEPMPETLTTIVGDKFALTPRPEARSVHVRHLSYDVVEKGMEWWQRLINLQLPCEGKNKDEDQDDMDSNAEEQPEAGEVEGGIERGGGGTGSAGEEGGTKKKKSKSRSKKMKRILKDINFKANSGQMLAVLGSSGSGKTTLLDVIACQSSGGTITGEVLLDGKERTVESIKNCSAYVRQDDRLLPHLTVRETLNFVAQLKLPTTCTSVERLMRVESVINELGLRHVADSKVGGETLRGISGGERRRVSIGIQLLLDPAIVFLDEPTSGLDSFTANHLVETLAKLARKNRVVLLTIHQPRSDIFQLFDLLMLLSQGEIVYFGKAADMVDYFASIGYPCPELTNPCDYYVDLSTVDRKSRETEAETSKRVSQLVQRFREHSERLISGPEPRADPAQNQSDSYQTNFFLSSRVAQCEFPVVQPQDNAIANQSLESCNSESKAPISRSASSASEVSKGNCSAISSTVEEGNNKNTVIDRQHMLVDGILTDVAAGDAGVTREMLRPPSILKTSAYQYVNPAFEGDLPEASYVRNGTWSQDDTSGLYTCLSVTDLNIHARPASSVRSVSSSSTGSDAKVIPIDVAVDVESPHLVMRKIQLAEEAERHKPGSALQFSVLFRRAMRNNVEDYGFLTVQAVEAVMMSLMIGLVFYDLGLDQSAARDRFGLLYIMSALYPYMVILDVIGKYYKERFILYFEMQDGLYTAAPYFFAKLLSDLPEHTFFIILYSVPVYFLSGLQPDVGLFFETFAIVYMIMLVSRSLALWSAALWPTYPLSVLVAQALFTLFLLSSGFIFNLDNLFVGMKWASYISYLKWGFQALCLTEMPGLNFTCPAGADPAMCMDTGEDALVAFSLDDGAVWLSSVILLGEVAFFLALFFIALKFKSQKPHQT